MLGAGLILAGQLMLSIPRRRKPSLHFETEEIQAYGFDLENGLASKETISQRRGYDYEAEHEKIEEEKTEADNIGSALLRAFDRGETGRPFQQQRQPPTMMQQEEEIENG